MECAENGQIIGGLNTNLSKEKLQDVIENDNIKNYLNYVNIKQGDSIYIPAGTVHAILKNTLICEIQQNSDTTYRVYDWDRKDKDGKGRQLHKKEAIETIKPESMPIITHSAENMLSQKIVESEFFEVEKINCKEFYEDFSNLNTFYAITVVEGEGVIETTTNKYEIKSGDSFLIPAALGKYKINGKIKFLKSYII
jgi:mannose-6-phosphate isomerase